MLPKQYRLPLKIEFKRIKKEGKLFQGRFFSLLVAKQQFPVARFAFIVSKKIHNKAVKRNRFRRLLIESVRFFLPQIKSGVDGVFLTKKAIIDRDFGEIKNEMEKTLKKAGLLTR